ncbi:MAG: hypothetical protein K6G60_01090 [Lachnospiraceae bacterium]|nr:hypothetical protein [Lachnospiraceae bacterium]
MTNEETRANEFVRFITEQSTRKVAGLVQEAKKQSSKKYKWNITQSAFAQKNVDDLVRMYAKA